MRPPPRCTWIYDVTKALSQIACGLRVRRKRADAARPSPLLFPPVRCRRGGARRFDVSPRTYTMGGRRGGSRSTLVGARSPIITGPPELSMRGAETLALEVTPPCACTQWQTWMEWAASDGLDDGTSSTCAVLLSILTGWFAPTSPSCTSAMSVSAVNRPKQVISNSAVVRRSGERKNAITPGSRELRP